MKGDCNGLTTYKPTEKMDNCENIMRRKVTLCKHVTLLPNAQILVKRCEQNIWPGSFKTQEFPLHRKSRPPSKWDP